MLIIIVLSKPRNDVAVRPIDLERVRVFIEDMVLAQRSATKFLGIRISKTHVYGHLIDVHALLNTKLGHEDVESCIQHIDHGGGADDWSIALSKIGNENAKEQMRRLLLG